jgi:hypothetical protein
LHLIAAPQLSGGQQDKYLTKTRQAGHANEQSIYSLMSMVFRLIKIDKNFCNSATLERRNFCEIKQTMPCTLSREL